MALEGIRAEPGGEQLVPAAGSHILVVDDSAATREVLEEVLASAGYDVLCVASAPRALEAMSHRHPALVITDLLMPGMSGFSLRAAMLGREDLASIPVIIVSGYWHRPGETLEASAVVSKPLSVDRLLDSVRRLVPMVGVAADLG